jgi:hypothetical protein
MEAAGDGGGCSIRDRGVEHGRTRQGSDASWSGTVQAPSSATPTFESTNGSMGECTSACESDVARAGLGYKGVGGCACVCVTSVGELIMITTEKMIEREQSRVGMEGGRRAG